MKEKFYNVWRFMPDRWVALRLPSYLYHVSSGRCQDPENPFLLTKEQAERWCTRINIPCEVREIKSLSSGKVIPDFPLDPTMHILQAGYIQDRQRKRS